MANGGLVSSAGWEKNDDSRTNANPRQGNSDRDARSRARYQEKMDSPGVRDYLLYQSQKMGDTEFVGDLVDHLTSNRYYSNDYSEALAGARDDLGPLEGSLKTEDGITRFVGDRLATMYDTLPTRDTLYNVTPGGKYGGATGYNDDKFGLVKLGLYGTQGPSSYQDINSANAMWNAMSKYNLSTEEKAEVMDGIRTGDTARDDLDWLEEEMGEGYAGSLPGSSQNQAWDDRGMDNPPPGVFWADRPGWVGGFNYDAKTAKEEDIFGKYNPGSDLITVSPDDKNVRETLVHELGHRGMSGLSRLPAGLVGSALEEEFGRGAGGETAFIDPTTGKHMTTSEFLDYGNRWPGGEGQSPEHNVIDASSRNRNNRYMFESFGTGENSSDPEGRKYAQSTYGVLGRVATNLLNKLQEGKAREVVKMRNEGPEWYGGKSGTAVSPLIPRR